MAAMPVTRTIFFILISATHLIASTIFGNSFSGAVRTIADYDHKTKSFILNTPDFEACKVWWDVHPSKYELEIDANL